MTDSIFLLADTAKIAENTYETKLYGNVSEIVGRPGTFVNIKIDGFYLRRPISVCDCLPDKEGNGGMLTIIYKVVGKGTEILAKLPVGTKLDILTGLGNGYNLEASGEKPLLIGGGAGVPPMFYLAKCLVEKGVKPTAILGFNKENEIFYKEKFEKIGVKCIVATADGSFCVKGFVTDAFPENYSYFYTCGPEPMLKAVYKKSETSGEFSFEERMGCGFGACMGCSCKTITGYKRICKDGPVLKKEEILWDN